MDLAKIRQRIPDLDQMGQRIQLALLFASEGQATRITDQTPCVLSMLGNDPVPEDSLIYDAQQAMWDGRAFPMTYEH
ncbi:MAG: hypothetical protein J1E64_07220 [Acetatifactor sp.]|nr:hypothetical protein [Acetatifactor sp.]